MTTATYEMFYLGNMADLDPTEAVGNTLSEDAGNLVGLTFGASGSPIFQSITDVTLDDGSGDNQVREDPPTLNDPISYDLGSGTVTSDLDSSQTYSATISYLPSSGLPDVTVTITVIQDELGNVFLSPPLTAGATATALEAGPIQSITINSIVNASFGGHSLTRYDVDLVCFAAGTGIRARRGRVPVEDLQPGDEVWTLDHGFRPLIWTGSRRVKAGGRFAPVVIPAGALGNDRELLVSPQHRLLFAGWRAELLTGEPQVLLPAISLVGQAGIHQRPGGEVTYHHIMFDRHEIVLAENLPSESFYLGSTSAALVTGPAREELLALFPELASGVVPAWQMARPQVPAYIGRLMV